MENYLEPGRQPERLLSGEEAKVILTAKHPDYGKDFTEKEWSQIAERLSALARLFWRLANRPSYEDQPRGDRDQLRQSN